MASLKLIALVVGFIAIICRLPGIIWPEKTKEVALKIMEKDNVLKTVGVVIFTLALIIFLLILKSRTWLETVMFMLAVLWLPAGVYIYYWTDDYKELAKRIMGDTLQRVKVLSAIGCAFGLLLVLLGLFG
jgi:hypothetical protein